MRRALALVVAAVVVFAPGPTTKDVRHTAPAELAGRVLAPTIEEGSIEPRGKPRVEPTEATSGNFDLFATSLSAAAALSYELWWVSAGLLLVWASRCSRDTAPARAPPLYPAV